MVAAAGPSPPMLPQGANGTLELEGQQAIGRQVNVQGRGFLNSLSELRVSSSRV
jgi:hypothetical protein